MNFSVYDATESGQSRFLVAVTRQAEIETVNPSVRSDGAETIRQSLDFAGRKIVVLFEPGPDLVQVGLRQALVVGSLGLLLTGTILWSIYYFIKLSFRLGAAFFVPGNAGGCALMAMSRHFFASSTVIADAGVPIEFRTTSATAADKPVPFKMRSMGAFQVGFRDFRDNGNYRTCAARDKYVGIAPESRHSGAQLECPVSAKTTLARRLGYAQPNALVRLTGGWRYNRCRRNAN
jgi:hypothetical protein